MFKAKYKFNPSKNITFTLYKLNLAFIFYKKQAILLYCFVRNNFANLKVTVTNR